MLIMAPERTIGFANPEGVAVSFSIVRPAVFFLGTNVPMMILEAAA